MRHLQKFRIGVFEVTDGFTGEALVAVAIDARDDEVRVSADTLGSRLSARGPESPRLGCEQPVEHPECPHEVLGIWPSSSPLGCHIQEFGIVPIEIPSNIRHAHIWSQTDRTLRDPFSLSIPSPEAARSSTHP